MRIRATLGALLLFRLLLIYNEPFSEKVITIKNAKQKATNQKMLFQLFILSFVDARAIVAPEIAPVSNHQLMVRLYSRTGRFMSINNRSVGQSGSNSLNSVLELVRTSSGLLIKSPVNGRFLGISNSGRVRTTSNSLSAAFFEEEKIPENNFSTFKIAGKDNCRLMASRLRYRVVCDEKAQRNSAKISFLAKKAHIPLKFLTGESH
jgi:hypothetical protein